MNKKILSLVSLSAILALSGCSQPSTIKSHPNAKVFSCGAYNVSLLSGNKTLSGTKATGRDSNGMLTFKDTAQRASGEIIIDSWAMPAHKTSLRSNGTFRMDNGSTWSFRNYNGKYYLGMSKYPNRKNPLDGSWCERKK